MRHISFGLLIGLLTSGAHAAFTFKKLVDNATNYPGLGLFTSLSQPEIHNGNVAFMGNTSGRTGLFLVNSSITTIVDTNTPLPQGGGNFAFTTGRPITVFGTHAALTTDATAYTNRGGFHAIAGPGGPGGFTRASSPSIDADQIAFIANNNSIWAERQTGLTLLKSPGFEVWHVVSRNGQIAYSADFGTGGTREGIAFYSPRGTVVEFKSAGGTPIPGGGLFRGPDISNSFSFDGQSIAFIGNGVNDERGVYTDQGGTLRKVADRNTLNPAGTSNFTAFSIYEGPSIDDGVIAFFGAGGGPGGIFIDDNGNIQKVITIGDQLGGRTINNLYMSRQSLSNDDVVFHATFTDGYSAVFIAHVPEPGGALVVAALIPLFGRRRTNSTDALK